MRVEAHATPIRVFLVDDHAILRQGLRLLLEGEPDIRVCGESAGAQDVVAQVSAAQPDVVIMDVAIRDGDGASSTEDIRRACPGVRVVALSRYSDLGRVRRMLGAGATGYLTKQIDAVDLLQAIRVVAAGGTYLDTEITRLMLSEGVDVRKLYEQREQLSDREQSVLKGMAEGRTVKEIAAALGLSPKTVDYHRARFCQKLGLQNRADIVRYALAQGWTGNDAS